MAFRNKVLLGFILIFIIQLFIVRDVFLNNKILFPSNFLAQFYSPWSTERFKGWEAGIPHKPIGTDPIREFYPDRKLANESLLRGVIPLWNPYVFSGYPFLGNYQSSIFYPLNFVYLLLPQISAWSILIFTQPILALIFTYLYLRSVKLSKISAFLGAFSFGFSSALIIWSQENPVASQTVIWLPLVLYGIEYYCRTKKFKYFLISVLSLSSSILAGFPQTIFYVISFVFIYSLFKIVVEKKRSLPLILLGIFLFSFAISSIQVIPSLEVFKNSPRPVSNSGYLFDTYLLPLTHLVNLLNPDILGSPGSYNFFGRGAYHETVVSIGIISLAFAIFAITNLKKNKTILFFSISAILSFFLTLASPITNFLYNIPLPLVSTFLPSRILLLTAFSLSVLSGYGISIWLESKKEEKKLGHIFAALIVISALIISYGFVLKKIDYEALRFLHDYIIRPNNILRGPESLIIIKNGLLSLFVISLGFFFLRFKKQVSILFLSCLIFFTQFFYLNKHIVLGYREFLYPETSVIKYLKDNLKPTERFLVLGKPILGNIWEYWRISSPEGMDPLLPMRYGQLAYAAMNGGVLTFANLPRIEVDISRLGEKESVVDNGRRLKLASLLGVKYLAFYNQDFKITLDEIFPSERFRKVWESGKWSVFENLKSEPRSYFADSYRVEKNPQKILDKFYNSDFSLNSVVLEEDPNINIEGTNSGSVIIESYKPEEILIKTKTDHQRILFLSDNYYPGWKAYINGFQTKIYRADYAFRAIVVPKGENKVEFVYEPSSFKIGALISGLGLLILGFIIVIKRKYL